MRVLLSTIGSRGDLQPLLALALELRRLGQEARVCAPPDFGDWIGGLGIPFTPVGPELRSTAKPGPSSPPSPRQRRHMAEATIAAQFDAVLAAAEGCDVIVAATALQVAARSVAERRGIGYVYAGYCPAVLPSPHHAPPVMGTLGEAPAREDDHRGLWEADARRYNDLWGAALNAHRTSLGLAPVDDVRGHMLTDAPWLAADPTLAPWPGAPDLEVFQPGAWLLPERRSLPAGLEVFLDTGEPPVYFGFGSVRAPEGLAEAMVGAARELGLRAIVLRGWAGLSLPDDGADCVSVGEVDQRSLFRRVAAVVHHGGAGTTTTAALAGVPQVVVPQQYDQHYFARRVGELGIGVAHPPVVPTVDSLAEALERVLRPEVRTRAEAVARAVRTDGARVAAHRLTTLG
ncbi:vancomycin aglycone glucosyltransferase [Saccharothrix coeruleofusca]|uniref:glycosyltransferase n=1 Tax=Saccharothrix coeruleofusca TaxID=33919 RepID=UPI001AE4BDCA|nr:glycosyltransferase [Saccharothrix coeruleofusca]MBP2335739.1 vancomycin aglycone glucosyltransferase [Saccharothrix coeruleofusca]